MALVRSDFTRLVVRNAVELYWDEYKEVDPVWTNFFREKDTEDPIFQSNSMLGMGDLEEREENEPMSYDQPAMGWPVYGRVRSFSKGISFSSELYNDTKAIGLFNEFIQRIAANYPRTRDRFFADFFNCGALTAGHDVFDATTPGIFADPTGKFIYDGKPLFAGTGNGHPLKMNSRSCVNYAPLPLTLDNLITVYKQMTIDNAYDEMGNKIIIQPDTLVIPQALEIAAMQLLNTEKMPNLDTTPSIANPMYRKFAVVVWPHLSDDDGWFLIQRGMGFKALKRQDMQIDFWYDPETKQYKGSVDCRFGGYVDNWRYAFACNTVTA